MRRIEVTPEEAKKKLCPRIQPFVSNQHTSYPIAQRCVATDCMHWAWASIIKSRSGDVNSAMDHSIEATEKGYCSS
jgi:hypothetical protein